MPYLINRIVIGQESKVSILYPGWLHVGKIMDEVVSTETEDEIEYGTEEVEDKGIEIFHCLYNSIDYHMDGSVTPPKYPPAVITNACVIAAVNLLVSTYPAYHSIQSLYDKYRDRECPVKEDDYYMFIESFQSMWEMGIIISTEGGCRRAVLDTYNTVDFNRSETETETDSDD